MDSDQCELQMLVVSLKEATKEVIQTVEQLLCDDTTQQEEGRNQVQKTHLQSSLVHQGCR